MTRIFISHSSRDNAEAMELKAWLSALGFENSFLDIDKDSGIQPGAEWEKTLYREIERAQAVLILVTGSWLASKWCFAEFTQARALGKAIFPLIVAPTGERIVGEDLQTIDLVGDRTGGLDRLGKRLREMAQQSPEGFELARGHSPFPGLAAFEEGQAAVFFGRDPEIRKAVERLRLCRTRGGERLILLLGASGSGKSSFLRAGLIPRLRRDRGNWIVLPPFRPGRTPRAQLVDCLLAGLGEPDADRRAVWRKALEGETPGAALTELARALRLRVGAPDAAILLPVDQSEEAVTLADGAERAGFFALLNRLLDDSLPFVAVAALRADHLPEFQDRRWLTAPCDLLPLDAMPLERIGALVHGPARVAHVRVEEGLVTALTRDAERPDALPLVAITLNALYERFGRDGALTLAEYESLGARGEGLSPLDRIVRERAEAALAAQGRTEEDDRALREAFVPRLVRVLSETGAFVRQAAPLDSFPDRARGQLERLAEARLLVRRSPEGQESGGMVEVAHEALFRVWPRLAGWLEQERDFLIGKGRIEQALKDWTDQPEGKDKDKGLLAGVMLDRARHWLMEHPGRFTDPERAYIRRSDQVERAEAARKQRMRRSLTAALAGLVVVLAAGVGTSVHLYRKQRDATAEAQAQAGRAEAALEAATRTANGLVFDLARRFRDAGLPNALVREILQRARDLQDRLTAENEGNASLQRSRAVALDELARSLADFGDPYGGRKAAETALAILRRLAEGEPDNAGLQRDLSVGLTTLADILLRSDPAKALALHEEGLAILRRLAEQEPDAVRPQRDLSASLGRIADILLRSDPAKARALHEEGLAILRRLVGRAPNDRGLQRDLSVSLDRIADILRGSDPARALALYEEGLAIRRRLAKREPDTTASQRGLSVSLDRIADILLDSDPAKALALYEESLAIGRRLAAREPGNTVFQRDLSVSLDNAAHILLGSDPAKALALYEEGLAISRRLAEGEPDNTDFQRDLSVSLVTVADILLRGDPARARALHEEGLAIRRRLVERERGNLQYQTDLVVSLSRLAWAGVQPEKHLAEALAILTALNEKGLLSIDQKPWIGVVESALADARNGAAPLDTLLEKAKAP